MKYYSVFFALIFSLQCQSEAAVTVDLTEENSGIQITVSGSVDISGLTLVGTPTISRSDTIGDLNAFSNVSSYAQRQGTIVSLEGAIPSIVPFRNLAGPIPGAGTGGGAIIGNGTLVSFTDDGRVFLDDRFATAGSPFLVSVFVPNTTFAEQTITDGIISSTSWISNTGPESVSFRTGSAVPEPSAVLLAAVALPMLTRRRRPQPYSR